MIDLTLPPLDLDARVVYLPVRHHSPACARQVERVIRRLQPEAVLVEAPADTEELIPLLLDPETRPPVAFYVSYQREGEDGVMEPYCAYYPFCAYSPELVALQAGAAVGASLSFIDLPYAEQVEARSVSPPPGVESLLEEQHLQHGRLLQLACQRSGTRDPDDLWDHLFETGGDDRSPETFFRDVLAYCTLSRETAPVEGLEADGTLARERYMAAAIRKEKGRVVVVTGGFHSVALPKTRGRAPKRQAKRRNASSSLVRYGFEQLDRLNGYRSGMPAPGFYQHLWEGQDPGALVVELGRRIRIRTDRAEVSVADEIAGLAHARELARLRGHAVLSREDVLDAVRSLFVKGSEEVEGAGTLAIVHALMGGSRMGQVPEAAGLPPLVSDFHQQAGRHRIKVGTARTLRLDLYRRARHRAASRFLHQVEFLEVPFGQRLAGPDFLTGQELDRLQESWEVHWRPDTEVSLVEASRYGSSLEEACTTRLLEQLHQQEARGEGGRADRGCQLLIGACLMGLHRQLRPLMERLPRLIAGDASFVSQMRAVNQLLALASSLEPLEAHQLEGLPRLAQLAWDRACRLVEDLQVGDLDDEAAVLDALRDLPQAGLRLGGGEEERAREGSALLRLAARTDCPPALTGGAMGLLYGGGSIGADDLVTGLCGRLQADTPGAGPAFLRGLLHTARSVLWQVPRVAESLDAALCEWDEDRFLRELPELRLAFSHLTPRETGRLAVRVAGQGEASPPPIRLGSADLAAGSRLEARLLDTLKGDGLL